MDKAGAGVINLQCSLDGTGDEDRMPPLVEAIMGEMDVTLCLDTRNVEALRKAVPLCKTPPIINYLSLDELDVSEEILSLCRENRCFLIIRALKGIIPTSLEGKLQVLEELIEMANSEDIPNGRLFADPSVVHIGRGYGQDHLVSTHDAVIALKEMVDPPINTVVWVSNISTGLGASIRSTLNATFLGYMAGAGLDAAFVDVFDREVMKTVYLIRAFRNETVFTPADLEG